MYSCVHAASPHTTSPHLPVLSAVSVNDDDAFPIVTTVDADERTSVSPAPSSVALAATCALWFRSRISLGFGLANPSEFKCCETQACYQGLPCLRKVSPESTYIKAYLMRSSMLTGNGSITADIFSCVLRIDDIVRWHSAFLWHMSHTRRAVRMVGHPHTSRAA